MVAQLHDELRARLISANVEIDERLERHQDLMSVITGQVAVIGPRALGAHRAGLASKPLDADLETTMNAVERIHDTTPAPRTVRDVLMQLRDTGGEASTTQ